MLSELICLVGGIAFGIPIGMTIRKRTYPTLQEKIDAALSVSTPATADDLVKLVATRLVGGAGIGGFRLKFSGGGVTVETPEREHLALLIPDVANFSALVAAAQATVREGGADD